LEAGGFTKWTQTHWAEMGVKLKKDSHGKIVKHKARLVAKGYVLKEGVDFEEAYAPVARLDSVRLLLALAAQES
jgi:hypothetical protein